jgi:hypothetical protein
VPLPRVSTKKVSVTLGIHRGGDRWLPRRPGAVCH